MPNATEWELEVAGIANRTEAYDKLGLPSAGFRKDENGVERSAGVTSFYWSRTAAAGIILGLLLYYLMLVTLVFEVMAEVMYSIININLVRFFN